MGCSITHTCRE